jgi:sarcosine oxidase, subunit gamma
MSTKFIKEKSFGQVNIRTREESTLSTLESNLNVSFPKKANTFTQNELGDVLWLGPQEWLLVTEYDKSEWISKILITQFLTMSGAAVNVSDNRCSFLLFGPKSQLILQKACAINIPTLKSGEVVQTVFGKTQIIIQCIKPFEYRLFVRTSFVNYTERLINVGLKEYL